MEYTSQAETAAQNQQNETNFQNKSYFIFPLKIQNLKKFNQFLKQAENLWALSAKPFNVQYLLQYVEKSLSDNRVQVYRFHSPDTLPIYLFDHRIKEKLEENKKRFSPDFQPSGILPQIGEIRLYVFQKSIAFLEFEVCYGAMEPEEIAEFVYLFRSLRNDETQTYLCYPEDRISLKTAIDRLFPQEESGTELCFENPSEVKRQANIFTLLSHPSFSAEQEPFEKQKRFCYLLANGYNNSRETEFVVNTYQFFETIDNAVWGGCQDGLASIVRGTPYFHQYEQLCNDYHFMYLILLNQRYSAIACIDGITRPNMSEKDIQEVYGEIASLKTRYSFRIVSNDSNKQTIYNRLYSVFEIDNLLKDTEDANARMNDIHQMRQQKHERRFNGLLLVLSLLAISSALIDLSFYLDRFLPNTRLNAQVSFGITLGTLIVFSVVLVVWMLKDHKRK